MVQIRSLKSNAGIYIIPLMAWLAFVVQHAFKIPLFDLILALMLILSTLETVKHAEIIAHRIGEPFGTLVLAIAVTIIESTLIISMMQAGGPGTSSLARDTVFAAVMIILNGMIGLSIFSGSIKHNMQSFVLQGVNSSLTALVTVSVLTLILPNYTTSVKGASYSTHQLIFVSIVSLVIYGTFIFVQNIRHKQIFI